MRAAIAAGEFARAQVLFDMTSVPKPPAMHILHASLLAKHDVPAAIEGLLRCRKLSIEAADRLELLSLLGACYMLLREFELAHEYFNEGRALVRER
jgi:hypothetical protein